VRHDNASDRVRELFAELQDRRLPWPSRATPEADDVVTDLASDLTYVAGLADSLLTTGSTGWHEIRIDASLVRRIARLRPEHSREDVDAIDNYRLLLDKLAEAISAASGVPLVRWDREREALDRLR
jgi:hypothetical protein